jgi:hypothetical protein
MSRFALSSWGAVLVAGLALGCTDSKEPAGQLMLAFDSDMAIPKDIDVARLRGDVDDYNQSTDFFVGPGANRLPGTFGVRAEDGKRKTVKLTLSAGKTYPNRTVGAAQTTIPTNRVALLRLPIQWLCTLRGHQVQDDQGDFSEFQSDCAEDETCNAGRCEKAEIPEEELPDYRPEDVFGGGLGNDESGTCFDTQESFGRRPSQIIDEDIDLETCRIRITQDVEQLNFALRVSDGDGVCISPDVCLVTLNRSERTGWFESDDEGQPILGGGHAQLPTIICDELKKGGNSRILDVYRAVGSPTKLPPISVCGPYSVPSCAKPPCQPTGGDDDPRCFEAGFDNDIDGDAVVEDPALAAFIDLSHDLGKKSDALQVELGRACVGMIESLREGGLEIEDSWSQFGYTPNSPTLDSVRAACAAALAGGAEGLAATIRLKLGVMPAGCSVSPEDQLACEDTCSPGNRCEEDRCPGESVISPACSGECDDGSVCRGSEAEPTNCNGLCDGLCRGKCEGVCTRSTSASGCEGLCEGNCVGFCEGECALEVPRVCGSSGKPGTCVGDCDRTNADLACAVPLESCSGLAGGCSAICQTDAALDGSCLSGGTFVARTPWEPQDAKLELAFVDDVLPKLLDLETIRATAGAISAAQADLDLDDVLSSATSVGARERECARVSINDGAGRGVTPSIARLEALAQIATSTLEPLLAYDPPPLPPECRALKNVSEATGQACYGCVADNCCIEYQGCSGDERCMNDSFTEGEAPCMIQCVLDNSEPDTELDPAVIDDCASECVTSGRTRLADTTVALLTCVDQNAGGSCKQECYALAETGADD